LLVVVLCCVVLCCAVCQTTATATATGRGSLRSDIDSLSSLVSRVHAAGRVWNVEGDLHTERSNTVVQILASSSYIQYIVQVNSQARFEIQ
jgi:hypothetical protein